MATRKGSGPPQGARAPTTDIAAALAAVAQRIQREVVIPHCSNCSRPCCKLTDVVLDLSWPALSGLYKIGDTKQVFDARLRRGEGPSDIRAQGGRYYTHGKPCPAYDEETKRCGVYGTALKPPGCSDFPIYVEGTALTLDLRCEAIDVDAIVAAVSQALPQQAIAAQTDPDFPGAFVSVEVGASRRRRRT